MRASVTLATFEEVDWTRLLSFKSKHILWGPLRVTVK